MKMELSTIFLLIMLGVIAGMLSGFVGVGGGVIVVPGLIYFFGLSQHMAQGTSLALMLPPIGILAVYNYYRAGEVNLWYAGIIAIAFVIGGFFGSKLSLKIPAHSVKFFFGLFMLYVAVRLILSSYKQFFDKG